MNSAKEALLDDVQRSVHHHPSLSSAALDIRDGDGSRKIRFDLVDHTKYEVRKHLIKDYEASYGGHQFQLVIEEFFQDLVTVSLVDTSVFDETVRRFLTEQATVSKPLEEYTALTLRHVEALEKWGAVGKLSTLEAKHIHDAFLECRSLLREENKVDDLLLRQLTA